MLAVLNRATPEHEPTLADDTAGVLDAVDAMDTEPALEELPKMYGALCLGSVLQLVPRIEQASVSLASVVWRR